MLDAVPLPIRHKEVDTQYAVTDDLPHDFLLVSEWLDE